MKNKYRIWLVLFPLAITLIIALIIYSEREASSQKNDTPRLIIGASRGSTLFNSPYTIYQIDPFSGEEISLDSYSFGDEVEVSPDGNWAISSTRFIDGSRAGMNSNIYLHNIRNNMMQQITFDSKSDYSPTWSPDGRFIAYVSGGGIMILSLECYLKFEACVEHPTPIFLTRGYAPDWSPSEDTISFQLKGHIYLISLDSRIEIDITPNFDHCNSPNWSPNAKKIVFICNDEIYLFDQGTSEIAKIKTISGAKTNTDWSADGENILFVSNSNTFGLGKKLGIDGIESNAIFIMNTSGENILKLSPYNDESILWYSWMP